MESRIKKVITESYPGALTHTNRPVIMAVCCLAFLFLAVACNTQEGPTQTPFGGNPTASATPEATAVHTPLYVMTTGRQTLPSTPVAASTTTPVDIIPPAAYVLLSSQVVSSQGGVVETPDISLSIPGGAFGSETEISLLRSSDAQPFAESAVSDTFRLQGLPDEFDKPLTLRIRYEGTLSGDSFIAVGEEVFSTDVERTTAYHLWPAVESDGFLIAELPPLREEATPTASIRDSFVELISYRAQQRGKDVLVRAVSTHAVYLPEGGHFRVVYPPVGIAAIPRKIGYAR